MVPESPVIPTVDDLCISPPREVVFISQQIFGKVNESEWLIFHTISSAIFRRKLFSSFFYTFQLLHFTLGVRILNTPLNTEINRTYDSQYMCIKYKAQMIARQLKNTDVEYAFSDGSSCTQCACILLAGFNILIENQWMIIINDAITNTRINTNCIASDHCGIEMGKLCWSRQISAPRHSERIEIICNSWPIFPREPHCHHHHIFTTYTTPT